MRKKNLIQAITLTLALMASLFVAASAQAASNNDGITPMIIGGEDATEQYGAVSGQTPEGAHRCGGVAIASFMVLTAAHCVQFGVFGPGAKVRVGSLDRTQGGQLLDVESAEMHPDYTTDRDTAGNDLALVFTKRRIDRSLIIPIAREVGPVGTRTRIAGWGKQCQDPSVPLCATLPIMLKQLDTVTLRGSKCTMTDPNTGEITFDPKLEICMGPASGDHEMACNGDSGGPMVKQVWHKGKRVWALVGITSRDGDDLYPTPGRFNYCAYGPTGKSGIGIYTKAGVARYVQWMKDRIAEHDGIQPLGANQSKNEFELVG